MIHCHAPWYHKSAVSPVWPRRSLDNVVFCKPFKKFKERCETLKSACLTELNTYVTEVNTLMESEGVYTHACTHIHT